MWLIFSISDMACSPSLFDRPCVILSAQGAFRSNCHCTDLVSARRSVFLPRNGLCVRQE
jgi:hypothetical protein